VFFPQPVVATTLMSLKHPIFKVRKFDYCIVDEGSQALPTAVFGILMHAAKCIVFGDPNQLPATIKSKEVK
jgi:superfamily I DNA and/or RNA helicase